MQRFLSTVTLLAFVVFSLPGLPPVSAQEVSAETSQRLREAVDRLNGNNTDGVPAQAPLSDEELNTLVAPYALYPDSLLAQVLVAATHPLQIAQADQLISVSDDMTDDQLAETLQEKDWDPSILVLLSGFPSVIAQLADDLDSTERLGGAMVGQDGAVLAAVQRMRAEAASAGNLSSNQAQIVTRDADRISIRPAKPDVIYVPRYDPKTVYVSTRTAPVVQQPQSTWNGQNMLVAGAVAFGSALLVQELFKDDDDKDSGWDDYWRRDNAIDWRDRQVYPRSYSNNRQWAWGRERDRYWDRTNRDWRHDNEARRDYDSDRQSALRWASVRDAQVGRNDRTAARAWREKARLDEARLDNLRSAREREARQERRERAARNESDQAAKFAAKQRAELMEREVERNRDAERAADKRRKEQQRQAEADRARVRERNNDKENDRRKEVEKATKAEQEKRPDRVEKPGVTRAESKPEPKAKPVKKTESAKKSEPEKRSKPKPVEQPAQKTVKVQESQKKSAHTQAVKPTRDEPKKQTQSSEKKRPQEQERSSKKAKACREGSNDKNCKPRN